MKENKEVKISYWASHLTTIVSVTLVLLIIGLMAFAGISASQETERLRGNLELNIVTTDSTTDAQAKTLLEKIRTQPYISSIRLISKKEALDIWTSQTGENLEEVFGVNPMTPEIAITLKSQYASPQEINRIKAVLSAVPGVEGIAVPETDLVEGMNENIQTFSWILGGVALVLVIISFVLINNTVHLSIYSRRFTIHTMQLVGATDGFVRRPLVLTNMLTGVVSGVLASAVLTGSLFWLSGAGFEDIISLIPLPWAGGVAAGLIITGAIICSLAAAIASTRYLHKDYDKLFR